MRLTVTPKGEVAQMLPSTTQMGAGQGGVGCMLRLRTGPDARGQSEGANAR